MVVLGSGNIEAEQTAPYQAYLKYKAAQQAVNASNKPAPEETTPKLTKEQVPSYQYEKVAAPVKTDYSEGTKSFNLSTEQDISFLKTAKEAGITEIDILNAKGEKIGQTNPQDIIRARYDILKLEEANVGTPIRFSYGIKETSTIKNTAEDKRLELANLEGKAAKETGEKGNEVTSFLKVPFIGSKVSSESIPSTSFANVLQFIPIGGIASIGSKTRASIVSKAGTILKLQSETRQIETALRENNLIIGTEKTTNPKILQISQGTESKSGIESFKPEKAPIQVERLPSGKVNAEQPPLPPNIPEKETILTVGRKGEAKPIEIAATINLEKGLEGQAKVPISLIGTEKILLVRREAQEKLPVNAVLVLFQGVSKEAEARQVAFYGLKKVPEGKSTYYGKLTPELAEKLNYDIKGEAVITGTDIFAFNKEDFVKNKELFTAITREPAIIQGKQLPEATRPFVIRTIEAKGYSKTDLANLPTREPETPEENPLFPKQTIEQIKDRYPLAKSFESSQIGTGEMPILQIGKTNPEAAKQVSGLFTKTQRPESRNIPASSRNKNIKSTNDFVFETIFYTTKNQDNGVGRSTEPISISISKNESSLRTKELNESVFNIINKSSIKEKQDQSMKEVFSLSTNQSTKQIPKQDTSQITKQTTKQTTKLEEVFGFGEVEVPPTRTKQPPDIPILNFNYTPKNRKETKNKGKKPFLFLGNVPQYDIIGVYKREDIIYGKKKINKITREEKQKTSKFKIESQRLKNKKFYDTDRPVGKLTKPISKKIKRIKF